LRRFRVESQAVENGRVKVAILGSGNVGTDLAYKLLKEPGSMEPVLMSGIDPESEGLRKARELGIGTGHEGIGVILEAPEIKIVFDATSARAHIEHATLLKKTGKIAVDLTPAAVGPYVVPVVNLAEHPDERNLNLLTCGAQATVPLAYAVSRVTPTLYVEAVSTLPGASAGPGMRQNIDEFTFTTARGLERVGGAKHGKAIVILSPSDPPIVMRNAVYVVPEDGFDDDEVAESIWKMVSEVQEHVPGYGLRAEPVFEERDTPWGRKRTVVLLCEVEGAGDFLPGYAGNLDVMTSAARRVGEHLARRLLGAQEAVA
jgi:acetaldehyde dehydrogenase